MNCPYCNDKMKKKILSSSRNIYLRDNKAVFMLPVWAKGGIGSKMSMTNIPVNYCETCNKIEIDLNQQE